MKIEDIKTKFGYRSLSDPSNGLRIAGNNDGKFFHVHAETGEAVYKRKFDEVLPFYNIERAAARLGTQWYFIHRQQNNSVPDSYSFQKTEPGQDRP